MIRALPAGWPPADQSVAGECMECTGAVGGMGGMGLHGGMGDMGMGKSMEVWGAPCGARDPHSASTSPSSETALLHHGAAYMRLNEAT